MSSARARAANFCSRFGLELPILLAPMAGACPPGLSSAVANAGGMGAAGLVLHSPAAIATWMVEFRAASRGPVQLNLWVPDPAPLRDAAAEARLRTFLGDWGPPVPREAGDATPPDFGAQCNAVIEAAPSAVSSVMGLYPPLFVKQLAARRIPWFAVATTVTEALAAEAAGADVIVAQGAEAGGHRGAFDASLATRQLVGLFALLPAIADAVGVPVVATGGIADGRGVAAALLLGASAVQVGTTFLRCPEAQIPLAWAAALGEARPEATLISRAFSGRPGRSLGTAYALAASSPDAPEPAPYPVQRGLTAAMRAEGQKGNDLSRIQAWAGQSAALGRSEPAADLTRRLWEDAKPLLA